MAGNVQSEKKLLDEIRIEWTASGLGRLFRNNVGTGWAGKAKRVPDGMLVQNPRPLNAGLARGSSDLIGWVRMEVTPEMVGETFAVFAAVEVKTESVRVTGEQRRFLEAVRDAGGFARVARESGDSDTGINWEAL